MKEQTGFDGIAVLGGGNIGLDFASGLAGIPGLDKSRIVITRKRVRLLHEYRDLGFSTATENPDAVQRADLIVVAVRPGQLKEMLNEIAPALVPGRHLLVSFVTGAGIAQMQSLVPEGIPVLRAMPNIALRQRQSMTCLCGDGNSPDALERVRDLFDQLGRSLVIEEELMIPATALCACGIAFFLRTIRAASQGGIQIGFHAGDALAIAAQTAMGAASLLAEPGSHPEDQIDRVTTPRGCTIAGLNEMEHHGFSSALIRGVVTSAEMAENLMSKNGS